MENDEIETVEKTIETQAEIVEETAELVEEQIELIEERAELAEEKIELVEEKAGTAIDGVMLQILALQTTVEELRSDLHARIDSHAAYYDNNLAELREAMREKNEAGKIDNGEDIAATVIDNPLSTVSEIFQPLTSKKRINLI